MKYIFPKGDFCYVTQFLSGWCLFRFIFLFGFNKLIDAKEAEHKVDWQQILTSDWVRLDLSGTIVWTLDDVKEQDGSFHQGYFGFTFLLCALSVHLLPAQWPCGWSVCPETGRSGLDENPHGINPQETRTLSTSVWCSPLQESLTKLTVLHSAKQQQQQQHQKTLLEPSWTKCWQ